MLAKSYGLSNYTTEVNNPLLNLLKIRRNSTLKKLKKIISSSHSNASESCSKVRITPTKSAKSRKSKKSGRITAVRY